MSLDNNQDAFFELVRAGLFPDHGEQCMAYSSVDWDELYRLAEEQSVMGLVATGLDMLPAAERPPQEVLLQYIGTALQIEQENIALNIFVAKLIERLRKEDIYTILLKGQGIAQCYEKPLWRASGDVDLLLSDANYEKAKQVLLPLATYVETEYTHFKHLGMTIEGWVVELHGTLHSRLSGRVDGVIDDVQEDVLYSGNVRSEEFKGSNGSKVQVFLPGANEDVIFVFTHILHHFFFEGIGLRQICDWCRLLWTYRDSLNRGLLESRIREAGLMTEWKAFAAFAVEYLGMPEEAMPMYNSLSVQEVKKFKRKSEKIKNFVMEVGNFGYKHRRDFSGMSYLRRKFVSSFGRLKDMLRHFTIFPKDSIVFFEGVLRSGLHAAVRGE